MKSFKSVGLWIFGISMLVLIGYWIYGLLSVLLSESDVPPLLALAVIGMLLGILLILIGLIAERHDDKKHESFDV